MNDCLFCKIASGDIPCDVIFEDDKVMAFPDISPQAPVHYLVIPKSHISSLSKLQDDKINLIGHLVFAATQICEEQGLDSAGYRFVINCGDDGGQTVPHLHLHILAGRKLSWPPG